MQCKQVRDHLSAYLDRELSAELASAVRHHLAACPECRALLEELRATADLLGRLPVRQAPGGMADDVRREIERRMLAPQAVEESSMPERTLAAHRARPWPRVLAVAACLALAAGIGLVAFFGHRALNQPADSGAERLAHHEGLLALDGSDAGRESEEATVALGTLSFRAVDPARTNLKRGTGYRVGVPADAVARGRGEMADKTLGGVEIDDGLDLRLRLGDTPAADLYGTVALAERFRPETDALATASKVGTDLEGPPAPKTTHFWAMTPADQTADALDDYAGLDALYAGGRVRSMPAEDGVAHDGLGVFVRGDGDAFWGFVDADVDVAPAEVLLGKAGASPAPSFDIIKDVRSRPEKRLAGAEDAKAPGAPAAGTGLAFAAPDADEAVPELPPAKGGTVPAAEAAPAETPLAPVSKAAVAAAVEAKGVPVAAPAAPADPQLVQMTMNTVAVGAAPISSLRRVATFDNLQRASNQLVVRASSRATANRDLVRLFGSNDWRPLDKQVEQARARKKAPEEGAASKAAGERMLGRARAGRGAEGLYYLANRNGEDLWVVLTTPDDLSRFAAQVAQSRTIRVEAESSRPFQAVRHLQQQLAEFEMAANRRSIAGKMSRMAGQAAGANGADRRGGTEGGGVSPKAGRSFGESSREEAEKAESAQRRSFGRYRPTETGEALGEEEAAGQRLQTDQGRQEELSEAKPPESADKPAKTRGAQRDTTAYARMAKEAEQRSAGSSTDLAALRRHFGLLRIPPNQIMLIVRVRAAGDGPHAAEAVQMGVEPAEPADVALPGKDTPPAAPGDRE